MDKVLFYHLPSRTNIPKINIFIKPYSKKKYNKSINKNLKWYSYILYQYLPKPSKTNSFCCVCKTFFEDYLTVHNIINSARDSTNAQNINAEI